MKYLYNVHDIGWICIKNKKQKHNESDNEKYKVQKWYKDYNIITYDCSSYCYNLY